MRCHHSVKQYALRARSTHDVHHAIVGVNVVIGELVVHCELRVVVRTYVPLVVVCDEAVVRRTLGLIALVVIVVFVVAILHKILLYRRYTLYTALINLCWSSAVNTPNRPQFRLRAAPQKSEEPSTIFTWLSAR